MRVKATTRAAHLWFDGAVRGSLAIRSTYVPPGSARRAGTNRHSSLAAELDDPKPAFRETPDPSLDGLTCNLCSTMAK
jgi:hypothetical protein